MYNVNEKGAIDFLLYSYFRITVNDTLNDIVDAVIDKAYKDATNQGAFNTQIKDENKEILLQCKEKAKGILKELVGKCFEANPLDSNWHSDACNKICEKYKSISAFTYGNAQKWVNMTLKNLYVIGSFHKSINFNDSEKWKHLMYKSSEFHIPIDNYILQAVWEKKTKKGSSNTKVFSEKVSIYKADNTYKIKINNLQYTWSQIPDYDSYMDIKNVIDQYANGKKLLDWENEIWLKIAKKRRSHSS